MSSQPTTVFFQDLSSVMENWDPFCEAGDEWMVCGFQQIRPKGEAGYGHVPGLEMFRSGL